MHVSDLTKQYDGKRVVDGVSFSIPKGKVLSLIGPNGAGKSTVMGMLSRLIARDSGLVDFAGRDIAQWKSKELAKRLAILTQSNHIEMKLTVRELVTFGRFPYSGSRVTQEDQAIIDQAIAYMELEDFQDRFLDELSGGQRQRAMIAMVIAQDTEYVLLDEPTNNLDIYHATNMMKIVRRLCDELGKTVILVLHEINYAAFYSDYICAFVDGKIAQFGTVKEVITRENLARIYHVDFEILEIQGKPCPSTTDRPIHGNHNTEKELSMRKIIPLILSLALVLALAACGSNDTTSEATTGTTAAEDTSTPTEVTITSLNGNGDPTDLTVPYDPQRIAILDMASLDILDALGLGDRVVGTASTSLDYLQSYINDEVENLGTIKEADLEAVMACEPDVIFIGGRLASSYDSLSEIAPVVYLATDTETGVVASVEKNARTIASLFGLEDQVDQLMEGFDSRIQALAGAAEGHTAIVGLVTSGSFNVLGNVGRCSIIGREVGYENIGVDAEIDTSTHGNEASFEFIVEKDPEYIFVLDRDAAIQTEGVQLAQEVMENDLVKGTQAYQNGNIVYLAHPAVWYTAEGGITALDLMLQDLESELLEE